MTIPAASAYQLFSEGLPKPNVPADYNRYFFDPSALPAERIVGMLACQRDPYLRTFSSKITASRKAPAAPVKAAKAGKADKAKAGKDKKEAGANGWANGSAAEGSQPAGDLWEVEFGDTILFPEGGGQPNDTGLITVHLANGQSQDLRVENVQRQGLSAVHHVRVPKEIDPASALEVGLRVDMRVDWERRFDHMTMHTGQHLVSALADTHLSLPTLSWYMPPWPSTEPCYVELPRGVTPAEARDLQDRANELVMTRGQREAGDDTGVRVWIESRLQAPSGTATPASREAVTGGANDPSEKADQGAAATQNGPVVEWGDRESRGLPNDYADGVIRTAVIDGVDRSLCCGTHHPSLSRVQLIHILPPTSATPSKSPTRLFMVAGPRAMRHLVDASADLTLASISLTCGRGDVAKRIEQRVQTSSTLERQNGKIRTELARLIAGGIEWDESPGPDGQPIRKTLLERSDESTHDNDFLQQVIAAVADASASRPYLFIVTSSLPSNSPHPDQPTTLVQMASHPPELAKAAGDKLKAGLDALEGGEKGRVRGGGAKGRFQGRVAGKWGKREGEVVRACL